MRPRRPYAPPTLTEHGDAVARTHGRGGQNLELINWRGGPPISDPPLVTLPPDMD